MKVKKKKKKKKKTEINTDIRNEFWNSRCGTYEDIVVTLEEDDSLYRMENMWAAELKRGSECLEDDPVREGQSPSPYRIPLSRFMISSWQTDEYYIATELDTFQDCIHAVIQNALHLSKVSAFCFPNLL